MIATNSLNDSYDSSNENIDDNDFYAYLCIQQKKNTVTIYAFGRNFKGGNKRYLTKRLLLKKIKNN